MPKPKTIIFLLAAATSIGVHNDSGLVAPRAIWAALWTQSSWDGKPHRSQRSQSPQVKSDRRAHDVRAILLGNTRRMMSSVRIAVLHWTCAESEYATRSSATLI
jgi:hypothetical protein